MKRFAGILLTAALLGCGGSDQQSETTLSFWQFWTSPDVKPTIEKLAADFEMSHVGVKVDLVDLTWSDGHEKIVVAFSTGSVPDIVELGSDWIGEFAREGVLAPVNDIFQDYSSQLRIWDPALLNDTAYAVPWLLGTRVVYCNLDLIAQAGFDSVNTRMTWDEFLEISRAVNNLGDDVCGFGSNSAERHRLYKKFLPFLWESGASVLDEKLSVCTLDSPAAVEALEYYVKLSDAGCIDTQRGLDDRFLAGEIAFIISGDWLLRRIENSKLDFRTVTVCLPTAVKSDDHVGISFAGGEYLTISRSSSNRELAAEFVKFMVSAGPNRKFASAVGSPTPANRYAVQSTDGQQPDELAETFVVQLENSRMPPFHPKWVYIEEILEKAVEKAIYDKSTPAKALVEATHQINGIIAE